MKTANSAVFVSCIMLGSSPAWSLDANPSSGAQSSVKIAPGQFADLPGVKLWYLDSGGAGTPVVFLHANTGTSESWKYQMQTFVDAGYRVIAFDRRGRGDSLPDPKTGAHPGSVSEDLDALANQLKLGRFHLVGVAGGGFVALDYASWHPEKLRSIVIGASTGNVQDGPVQDAINRIEITEVEEKYPSFFEIGPSYRAVNPQGVAEWDAIEHHAHSQPGEKSQPLRTKNTLAKIETIKVPALVIAAGADLLAPPPIMKMWADHLRGHNWVNIPEAGHSIAWEKPAQFNAATLDFIGQH